MKRINFTLIIFAIIFTVFTAENSISATVAVVKTKDGGIFELVTSAIKRKCKANIVELSMAGDKSKAIELAQQLRAMKPDVVVALGTMAAKMAKSSLTNIPIVYSLVVSPDRHGLTGDNITGVILKIPAELQIRKLKEIAPKIRRLGIAYNPKKISEHMSEVRVVTDRIPLTVVSRPVSNGLEIPKALKSMQGKIDALYLPPDRTIITKDSLQFMILFSIQNKLPFLVPSGRFVKKGGLVALDPDFTEIGAQTAKIVNKVLSGTPVGKIAPEFPANVKPVINEKTMKQIGIN